MRQLGKEFEERYSAVFAKTCVELHVTPANVQTTFENIMSELFSDGVKWGRVVALFAFGGCLAVECVHQEMPFLVDQVVELMVRYLETHLVVWIQRNGGWEGFVEFYEGSPDMRNESPWPSLKQMCGYAIGAIGVLTLGAILSQKT
jgi:hypothetical protein